MKKFSKKRLIIFLIFFIGILAVGTISSIFKNFVYQDTIEIQKQAALKEAKRILNRCEGKNGEQCYYQEFKILVTKQTLNYGLQVLSALEDIDPSSRGCHLIAHGITLAETEKDPSKWKDLLAEVDSNDCSGGFVHGVLEARAKFDSTFNLNEKTIREICSFVGEKHRQGGEFNCAHIIGHLLMVENVGDINASLAVCDTVPLNLQYECYSGVFMENETRDNLVAHSILSRLPWNKKTTNDQENICRKQIGLAAQACFRELAHMYAFISSYEPSAVYKLCSNAPDEKSLSDCYHHGIGIMIASSKFDLSNMEFLCKPYLADEGQFKNCVFHAINSLLISSTKFADRVIRLCEVIPDKFQKECFQRLGDKLGVLVDPIERKKLCNSTPQHFRNLCEGLNTKSINEN